MYLIKGLERFHLRIHGDRISPFSLKIFIEMFQGEREHGGISKPSLEASERGEEHGGGPRP